MNPVFADTFYWLALLSPTDQAHHRAVQFTTIFRGHLITTAWIITEIADALSTERARSRFVQFFDRLRARDDVTILPPSEELFEAGVELYRRRLDKEWSLTDCISFAAMEQKSITAALTGDRHFEQAGFAAMLK
jgi:hypothetical protein